MKSILRELRPLLWYPAVCFGFVLLTTGNRQPTRQGTYWNEQDQMSQALDQVEQMEDDSSQFRDE